ncbi:Ribonuclease H-like protein [Mycena sanguinolenta]|uniref:ribonuclease H n=1 Tax=Mycena sanguinolenta TaxID=230812 RepID=A0A8H6XU54_9AGAR|nr:Ribonuclease H-like protein [Mycena sanguinolenta]
MTRAYNFCPGFGARGEDTSTHFYDECDFCGRFFARCCASKLPHRVCHDHPLVFVDGSCSRNGQFDARAGIGCAMGNSNEDQVSILVTYAMDACLPRTSQRAELLAALHGLRMVVGSSIHDHPRAPLRGARAEHSEYVIVADSEYVVKGITEWVPVWKANSWRTKQGNAPKNLDLFKQLDAAISEYETKGFKIKFLHVRRKLNCLADGLAARAAAMPIAI